MENHIVKSAFRDNYFKDQVILITGGTSKMLYQAALDFMRLGGKIALISRRLDLLEKVAEELKQKTGSFAKGYQFDLKKASDSDYAKLVDQILNDFGRIDILINGAAGNFLADAENLSLNAFKTILEIDTLGTFLMSKWVYSKYMKKNGGKIINISASLHYLGTLLNSHAAAAKAGVDAITKTLALEWGPKGVRVNGVAPGAIEGTEGYDRLIKFKKHSDKIKDKDKSNIDNSYKDLVKDLYKMIPLQKLGNRQDISNTILYLASDLSSYVTGQTILTDGGMFAIIPNWMPYFPEFLNNWRAKF